MGILDDAIREHLDLKRRHGAQDADIRQLEDEAFGEGELADPFAAGSAVAAATAPEIAQIGGEGIGVEEAIELEAPETPLPPGPATPAPAPGSQLPDAEDPFFDERATVKPGLEPEWDAEAGLVEGELEEEEIIEPPQSEAGIELEPVAGIEPGSATDIQPPDAAASVAGDATAEPAGPLVPPPPPDDAPASRPGGETARIVEPPVEQDYVPEPRSDPLDAPDQGAPDVAGLDDSVTHQVELEQVELEQVEGDEAGLDDAGGDFYDFATDADFAERKAGDPAPEDSSAVDVAEPPQSPAQLSEDAAAKVGERHEGDEAELDAEDHGEGEAEFVLHDDELAQDNDELAEDDDELAEDDDELADEAELERLDGDEDDDEVDEEGDARTPREFAEPEEDEDPLERPEFAPAEDDDSGELWFEHSEPEDFDFKD